MVMTITIEAFGEVELNRTLLRIEKAAEDMTPAFDSIHTQFLHLEEEQFTSGGKYSSEGHWAPLAPSTVAAKTRAGLDPRILIATEQLYKSLTDATSPDHIYQVTADTMRIASKIGYGAYHQSREPRSRLPRRPPVALPDATKKHWVKILQAWLMEAQVNAR
jgi:hypothetical protein